MEVDDDDHHTHYSTTPPPPMLALVPTHDGGGGGNDVSSGGDHRALVLRPTAIATVRPTRSRFTLPPGWRVRQVLRSNGYHVDKYYREPGTGRTFRSMKDVQRYMNGEIDGPNRPRSVRLDRRIMESGNQKMVIFGRRKPDSQKAVIFGGRLFRYEEDDPYACGSDLGPSHINLPDGWVVEEVPRRSGGYADRYYYEPGTGLKFRSLIAVERHLAEREENNFPLSTELKQVTDNHLPLSKAFKKGRLKKISGNHKMVISCRRTLKFEEDQYYQRGSDLEASHMNLPDGWVVEEVPRSSGGYSRYYYEPGTGVKFRSLTAVKRHLAELNENNLPLSTVITQLREDSLPLSKAFKMGGRKESQFSSKKAITKKKTLMSRLITPPNKIKWVISSSGGDTWNAFLGDSLVSEAVRKQWAERFTLAIHGCKLDEQNDHLRRFKTEAETSPERE